MRESRIGLSVIAVLCLVACGGRTAAPSEGVDGVLPAGVEARSLDGRLLFPPELPAEVRAERELQLAEARENVADAPASANARIWLGRRTAYLGRYREAIEIFSAGVDEYPEDPRFYRHRGHRYITVREFDRALADLERGTELIAGSEDVVEPDGLPNPRNLPRSTLQSNLWYHLGLAYYLKNNLRQALWAYRQCLAVSKNDDMLVATSYWLYMTLRRLGLDRQAATVLEPISETMDIIENHDYHELLLLYRGKRRPEELLARAASATDLANATLAYGVGNWYFLQGKTRKAVAIWRRVIEGPQWAAFGYIASEADLQRLP